MDTRVLAQRHQYVAEYIQYNLKTWSIHNSHLETRAVPLSLLSKRTGACTLVVFAVAKQP